MSFKILMNRICDYASEALSKGELSATTAGLLGYIATQS